MRTIWTGVLSALAGLAGGAAPAAQERIFVDQWSPTESVLIIADADGANRRKLVAGSERDYNASFSFDDEWVVFTSERHGLADIFRVRTDGMGLELGLPLPQNFSLNFLQPLRYGGQHGDSEARGRQDAAHVGSGCACFAGPDDARRPIGTEGAGRRRAGDRGRREPHREAAS